MSLLKIAQEAQAEITALRKDGVVPLTGHAMNVASIVAIARYDCLPTVDDHRVLSQLSASVQVVKDVLPQSVIYGANTGFGGSANVRTGDQSALERSLMQLLQSGVLTKEDKMAPRTLQGELLPHAMPTPWVKATMATRVNQCVRGHSALSREVIKAVLQLAHHHIVPITPLRGSISASGDLMPLSYLAGTLEGSPDIYVSIGTGTSYRVVTAQEALAYAGIEPQVLGPRAGLGLVNGTAASAATAGLAMFDAAQLAITGSALSCLITEGMAARVEWLHPFVTEEVRPHPGQTEVGQLMRRFLENSRLVSGLPRRLTNGVQRRRLPTRPSGGLAQDRYPLRTSPQWLGPQYEDLVLAHSQIKVELNSTSDNPVTDAREGGGVYHSGNFQAASVTSAVEKIRKNMSMIGKMLFSQCTEMLNYELSAGLPPNLAADDPTVSFCLKGLDINIASYQSELSFLANTISNHVQSAEMHNQAINSLAFLATRYTIQALEVLALMVASVLYAACQAIDLRVLHTTFLDMYTPSIAASAEKLLINGHKTNVLKGRTDQANEALRNMWWKSATMSPEDRCFAAASAFVQDLCELTSEHPVQESDDLCFQISLGHMLKARQQLQADMLQAYKGHAAAFLGQPTSAQYLGLGTRELYNYVRTELNIPIHRGLDDHPTLHAAQRHPGTGVDATCRKTIGSQVSKIYEAVRDGRLYEKIMALTEDLEL